MQGGWGMKLRTIIISLFATSMLVACNTPYDNPIDPPKPAPAPDFETYTLDDLFLARLANSLQSLDKKYVSIKGKATFAKRISDTNNALFIQSGQHAVEVTYPSTYIVGVGDIVEVKGQFEVNKLGDVYTIRVNTNRDVNKHFDINFINEFVKVEPAEINSESDLVLYDSSVATIDFNVLANRTGAAFVGKLDGSEEAYIVANSSVADPIPEGTYSLGDKVSYDGIFTYGGDNNGKYIRYYDKEGLNKVIWNHDIDREMRNYVNYVLPLATDLFDPNCILTIRGNPESSTSYGYFHLYDNSENNLVETTTYGDVLTDNGFIYDTKEKEFKKAMPNSRHLTVSMHWSDPSGPYNTTGNYIYAVLGA